MILDVELFLLVLVIGYGFWAQSARTAWLSFRLNRFVENLAREEFAGRYGPVTLEPVVAVIPAYNEAENIGRVLSAIPAELGGRRVSVLVVIDGGDDGTEQVVARHGGRYLHLRLNQGGGRAIRLGTQVAAEYGAEYVVTLDADGQHIPSEMSVLLAPLFSGQADLVQGSRRLGAYEKDNPLRLGGVYVFGWLISLLTKQRITDSSNGFRALRADLLLRLNLQEDQYYSPELLLKASKKGYKVLERPVTILRRHSGQSKKGKNLAYGYRYMKAILKAWLSET